MLKAETLLKPEDRQRCEIWTRVMGYCRPTTAFNKGKKSEFNDRVWFTADKAFADEDCGCSALKKCA